MRLELRDHDSNHLIFVVHCQETEVAPLVKEIAVNVDAVGLREILGDQLAHCSDILVFASTFIPHIAEGRDILAHSGVIEGPGVPGWLEGSWRGRWGSDSEIGITRAETTD
jgi:hypothetical protein